MLIASSDAIGGPKIYTEADLNKILKSTDVIDKVNPVAKKIKKDIGNVTSTLEEEMNRGCSESIVFNGDSPYNKTKEVHDKYETLQGSINSSLQGIVEASQEKEREDLKKLKNKIEDTITKLETIVNNYANEYSRQWRKIKEGSDINKNINILYSQYYGSGGHITNVNQTKAKQQELLDKVNKRISSIPQWTINKATTKHTKINTTMSASQIKKNKKNWNYKGNTYNNGTYQYEVQDSSNRTYIIYADKDKNLKYYQDSKGTYYDKKGNKTTEQAVLQGKN